MLKCASFFAGVGGIDLGFKQAGMETVYANEFDPYAASTFEKNFKDLKVDTRDINEVVKDIPGNIKEDFDVLLAGFPCQAFSIAGYRQGFDDVKGRGELFFRLIEIMKVKRPRVAFFENVKNLVGHDGGNTFRTITGALTELGYTPYPQIMNACEYGNVPQNRERIYIVAFRDKEDADKFRMPEPVELKSTIRDVIDFDKPQDEYYYYSKEKCKFYDVLKEGIKRTDTIYQWRRKYVRENKSNVVPTLTANMGTGGHNVPLILTSDGRIRKLTPEECFYVQGYPREGFELPDNQARSHLYKQAGNSVVVPVIKRIAEKIMEAVKSTDTDRNPSITEPLNAVAEPLETIGSDKVLTMPVDKSDEIIDVLNESLDECDIYEESFVYDAFLEKIGMTKEEFEEFYLKLSNIYQVIKGK